MEEPFSIDLCKNGNMRMGMIKSDKKTKTDITKYYKKSTYKYTYIFFVVVYKCFLFNMFYYPFKHILPKYTSSKKTSFYLISSVTTP